MIKLFISSVTQVALVAANTFFIATLNFPAIFTCSFLISLTWTWNVKRVVLGGTRDRLIYAAGASFGGITGVFLSKLVS